MTFLEKGLQLEPENTICLVYLAVAYSLGDRREDARKTAAKFRKLNPRFSVGSWAKRFKDPGVFARFIGALPKAGLK